MDRNFLNLTWHKTNTLLNEQLWLRVLLIGASGLLVGFVTFVGQFKLPGSLNVLFNSGSIWVGFAFFVSALMPSTFWAILAGFGTQLAAVVGFYIGAIPVFGMREALSRIVFWTAVAVIAGPVFGLAGYWWRAGTQLQRVLGLGLIGGIFVSEGIYLRITLPHKPISGWGELIFGLALPLLLGWSLKDRLYSYIVLPIVVVIGLGSYWLVFMGAYHFLYS